MLPLTEKDRVRVLSAVANRGSKYKVLRIVVITLSLAILLVVPLSGAVRVDLWAGHHLLLGRPVGVIDALKGFVVAMAVIYGFTFLTNTVIGRFFCGWGCPVGYTSRLGEDVARMKDRRRKTVSHLFGAGFVATFVGAIMLWWVDPRVVIEGSPRAKVITAAVFAFLWTGGFLHAFLWRFGFCLSACPIGFYYRYVTSKPAVSIVFDQIPDPCIECGACETICPVLLDPKSLGKSVDAPTSIDAEPERYGDAECLRCGDCVEACRMVFVKSGGTPPLRFGRSLAEALSKQNDESPSSAANEEMTSAGSNRR